MKGVASEVSDLSECFGDFRHSTGSTGSAPQSFLDRQVNIQTRDRFGNAIEVNGGDIVTGLLYGEQQADMSFVGLLRAGTVVEWQKTAIGCL